ncbi:hypothetical protein ACOMCU_26920 [Lysinibacillus sp. UGB7]|uniref:hypothetical protein n=1 Tax=Lysinibacillus sp. UGB7 TaxID=3411039 RepID=UPI003B818F37
MTTETLKLSELADDVEVSVEESNTVYTVAELKREILELDEPHHKTPNWSTVIRQKWSPCANSMLDSYIDNEYQEMYEDWDDRAWDMVAKHDLENKIQALLDEAFESDYATAYWTYDKPVEIDIYPNSLKIYE